MPGEEDPAPALAADRQPGGDPAAVARAPDDAGFGPLRRRLLDRLGVPLARN
ncbi:hypothetical protein [Actinoplanes auranticolor]|uniref:hypothetical protein n=1 Tax=Actinoplanes auranticolor TaxID=47988 RepID=UPI001BB40D5C|nr:hypothetical protein [Actinoplanes auranticolor]